MTFFNSQTGSTFKTDNLRSYCAIYGLDFNKMSGLVSRDIKMYNGIVYLG